MKLIDHIDAIESQQTANLTEGTIEYTDGELYISQNFFKYDDIRRISRFLNKLLSEADDTPPKEG